MAAKENELVYKVDKTNIYSASSKMIEFETAGGLQQPLSKWYRSFPDPTINPNTGEGGREKKDYAG